MTLTIENLPPYESITCQPIRDAAAAFDAAKAAQEQARKDQIELEQTRDAAEWRDAEASETAIAAGKPAPKRTEVAAHDRKTDEARHQLKVAQLAAHRTEDALIAALEEHGDAWVSEIERGIAADDKAWDALMASVASLHAKRAAPRAVAQRIGVKCANVGALEFKKGAINGVEFSHGQHGVKGYIWTEDALAALATLGAPEPEPDPESEAAQGEPAVDLEGIAPLSYADAWAGAPTQAELETAGRTWDATHER